MPTRRKPKSWESVAEVLPLPPVTQREIVQGIETVLGPLVNFSCVDTEKGMQCFFDVIEAARCYRTNKTHIDGMPRRADQREALTHLHSQIDNALKALQQLDDATRMTFALSSGYPKPS